MTDKLKWIASQVIFVTAVSLIAAAITSNPNWPWNIPLGLAVGAAWGWLSWSVQERVFRKVLMKLTNEFTYLRRNPAVQAVWWNGDNRDEVIRFFRDCGLPEDQGPHFIRDEFPDDEYNMITFYAGDDVDIDVKHWIVYHDEEYRSWTPGEFRATFDADLMS